MSEWMNISEMAEEQPEKRIHMERYVYAASVLAGKRILDCACGMGYGTIILGPDAVGVDIDPEAIALAHETYPGRRFEVGNLYTIPMEGYDAFVSFETLEHLDEPAAIIDRLPECITDIVVSAPIRPTVGWNPWHRSDFTHGTFCQLIERAFRVVHLIGQPWVDGKGDLYLMIHGRRGAWVL
jgi:2-polyprenyl-3-methyl-5-hydroxy-6-metoxy-1,4-benzoquinol methylase